MKQISIILPYTLFIIILLLPVTIYGMEDNKYVALSTNGSVYCDYIYLPQDFVSGLDKPIEAVIEVNDNKGWSDTSIEKVHITDSTSIKIPICFYYSANVGDNAFYNIKISSPDIPFSNTISGGLCVSDYEDVDIVEANRDNACDVLSTYSDVFDIQPEESRITIPPNSEGVVKIYITSYASISVNVRAESDLSVRPDDTNVILSKDAPIQTKKFKIRTGKDTGHYTVTFTARIDGCYMDMCMKQVILDVEVADKKSTGFSAMVVPKTINIKNPHNVWIRVVIINHEKDSRFNIEVSENRDVIVVPAHKEVFVPAGSSKTVLFNVSITKRKLNRIEFKISSEYGEIFQNAYISVGEMVSDVEREADEIIEKEGVDNSIKNEISQARNRWIDEHSKNEYGSREDFSRLKAVKNEIKKARGHGSENPVSTEKKREQDRDDSNENNTGELFGMAVVVIIIVATVALIVFYMVKKSKVHRDLEYPDIYGGF